MILRKWAYSGGPQNPIQLMDPQFFVKSYDPNQISENETIFFNFQIAIKRCPEVLDGVFPAL